MCVHLLVKEGARTHHVNLGLGVRCPELSPSHSVGNRRRGPYRPPASALQASGRSNGLVTDASSRASAASTVVRSVVRECVVGRNERSTSAVVTRAVRVRAACRGDPS
jgi:hypothetical protein